MTDKLQFHEDTDIDCFSSTDEDCVDYQNKRSKFQGISSKNFTDIVENIFDV